MKRNPFFMLGLLLLGSVKAQAQLSLPILDPDQLNGLFPNDVAKETVRTVGIFLAHRPYQGAISIFNNNTLDLKIEATMMKIGDGIVNALIANGITNPASQNISAPILKLHARKALGPAADLGVSGIFLAGMYTVGTDLKLELYDPEEGISSAFRLGYSYAKASRLFAKTVHVISPEIVFSRRLSFAEPYLGIGGRYMLGTASVSFDLPPFTGITIDKSADASTAYAFTGVNFEILGPTGFRLGIEGTYDLFGFSSIGTVFGVGF